MTGRSRSQGEAQARAFGDRVHRIAIILFFFVPTLALATLLASPSIATAAVPTSKPRLIHVYDVTVSKASAHSVLQVDAVQATEVGQPEFRNFSSVPLTGGALVVAAEAAPAEQAMLGRPAAAIERTLETSPGYNPQGYVDAVAEQFGINLRGSGQSISAVFDESLPAGQAGVTRAIEGGRIIRIGPDALSGGDAFTANTIAHELSHTRYLLQNGSFAGEIHAGAYASGDALQAWILGKL